MKPLKPLFCAMILAVMTAVCLLNGCSSSSDGDSNAPVTGEQGIFWDGPVEGLSYACESMSGVTDAQGRFRYTAGKTVAFSLGDIAIGSAAAASLLTPIDLVQTTAGVPVDHTHDAVVNIVRFLLTLDSDADAANGIQIAESIRNRADGQSLDFSLSAADFAVAAQSVVNALIPSNSPTLKDAATAAAHIQTQIASLLNVTRDDKGVWFIKEKESGVSNLYSVYEAMGYNTAVDRLFQVEQFRLASRGRLAEFLGASYLEQDMLVRTTAYTDQELRDSFNALDPESRTIYAAFAAGFNRRIAEVRADEALLPLELLFVGITQPSDWTAYDLMAWGALMMRNFDPEGGSYDDPGQINTAALYQDLIDRFGASQGEDMFDDLRWPNDPAALTYIQNETPARKTPRSALTPAGLPDLRNTSEQMTDVRRRMKKQMEEINAYIKMGSYAWTIAGSKTASGNATIYSGPQMGFPVPSIVMEGAIDAAGLKISGMLVPGLPAIVIGRTPHHAWSMQVGHAHTTDYYIEDAANVTLNRTETIKVKNGNDVTLNVYRSSHGPIVSPMPFDPATSEPVVAWKYSHWGHESKAVKAYLAFARAQSMDEFGAAIEDVPVSQHFCYADRDGNIAYWMSGRDPVRVEGADPRFPQQGDGTQDWPEPVTLKPRATDRNTSRGFYAGWNNKASADHLSAPNNLSYLFGPAHRAHVLEDYLSTHDDLTFEQIRDLALNIAATDSFGAGGNPWTFVDDRFSQAVLADSTAERSASVSLLEGWDGHFVDGGESEWATGTDRADAWILMDAWISEVIRLTFGDELPMDDQGDQTDVEEWRRYITYAGQPEAVLFNVLLHGLSGDSSGIVNRYDWFTNTADASAPQTADAVIVRALDNVLAALGDRPWGTDKRGLIAYNHPGLGEIHSMPFSSRSTYAHCVEFGPAGPVRIESMFPLGQSGFVSRALQYDENYFSMARDEAGDPILYDIFEMRSFPLFD